MSAADLVRLIQRFDSCSHTNCCRWSFWDKGSDVHYTVCAETGRLSWTNVLDRKTGWTSVAEVLGS